MAQRLRKLKLRELSLVDRPANQHARVVLLKRDDEEDCDPELKRLHERVRSMNDRMRKFADDNGFGPSSRVLALKRRVDALLEKAGKFDESKHPRKPKGDKGGGQFTSASGGGAQRRDSNPYVHADSGKVVANLDDPTSYDTIYRRKQHDVLSYLEREGWDFAGPTGGGGGERGEVWMDDTKYHDMGVRIFEDGSWEIHARSGEVGKPLSSGSGISRLIRALDKHSLSKRVKNTDAVAKQLDAAQATVRDALEKAGKGNPYHKPKGPGGGQFTSASGGGSSGPIERLADGRLNGRSAARQGYFLVSGNEKHKVGDDIDFYDRSTGDKLYGRVQRLTDSEITLRPHQDNPKDPNGDMILGKPQRFTIRFHKSETKIDSALELVKAALGKRDFSGKERERLAGTGAAMSDGSFPISNISDLHNAVRAIGRAKNPAAAKAHIKRRAKVLGATDALPENWK